MADKQIKCIALEKWNRLYPNIEIHLEEGDELVVLKTSMSGWWYVVNQKGVDGLVPFTHLQITEGNWVDFSELAPAEYEHIEKTVFGWNVATLTQFLKQYHKQNAEEQVIFIL